MARIPQTSSCFSAIIIVMIGLLMIISIDLPVARCYFTFGFSLSTISEPEMRLASSQTSGTNVSGYIMTNTTWSSEASPIIVTDTVIVVEGVELSIEAGTVVRFSSGTSLIVDGFLNATGNELQRIVFTSDSLSSKRGDWGTIEIGSLTRQTGRVSNITFWTIEYSSSGIQYVGNQTLLISNTILRNNNIGLQLQALAAYVENCEIVNNNIGMSGGIGLTVRNSIISGNGLKGPPDQGGGILGGGSTIENCTFSSNLNTVVESPYSITNSTFSNNLAYYLGQDVGLVSNCKIVNNSRSFARTHNVEHCNISWNGEVGNMYRIVDSVVTHNYQGLDLMPGGEAEDCIVTDNGLYGIRPMANARIIQCIIRGNDGPGVTPNYGFQPPFEIHYCRIYNNSVYDLTLRNSINTVEYVDTDVNASDNWWGTVNETLIGNKIYDYYDNYNLGRVLFEPFLTSPYFAEVEGKIYDIGVSGNSIVSNFFFYRAEKSILFDVSDPQPTGGNFTISIPNNLMWGEFTVLKDNELLIDGSDYTHVSNSTHFTLNFIAADPAIHSFRIEASQVVPEFSFYPFLVILTIVFLVFAIKKKLKFRVR